MVKMLYENKIKLGIATCTAPFNKFILTAYKLAKTLKLKDVANLCKKFFCCVIAGVLLIFFANTATGAEGLQLSAGSAVVICADTGKILFGKNEYEPRPMASTTKIMTALLTLEAAEGNDTKVTITDKMVPVEGSSMYLQVGQMLPLSSLAKGMLTVSGNDAANSAAIIVGGSVDGFVDLMNKKAKQIGMNDTFFETPSGLDQGNHHSTAYDMALLGAYALENKAFFDISSKRRVDVQFFEPDEIRTLYNENRMLKRYEGCIGVKTGFTRLAGRCLVSAAERNSTRLVAVTLNAGDDWNDHEKLLDYGFSRVESVCFNDEDYTVLPIVGGVQDDVTVYAREKVSLTVENGQKEHIKKVVEVPHFLYAPVKQGQVVGKIKYILDDKTIAANDLVVSSDVEMHCPAPNMWQKFCEFFTEMFKRH